MYPNAERDSDAEAYWRRRAAILAVGLLALGLLAWAMSGSGGSPAPRSGPAPGLAQEQANKLPAAAYGSSPAVSPSPASSSPVLPGATIPLVSGSAAAPAASPSPTADKPATARPSRHGTVTPAGGSCRSGGIVVTLLPGKPSYHRAEQPSFDVYAVSTAPARCTFSFGGRSVRVLVRAHHRTVWDSAACPAPATHQVSLIRGVPAQMSVTWNRRVQHPRACRGTLPASGYGKFYAVARVGGLTSQPAYFELVP